MRRSSSSSTNRRDYHRDSRSRWRSRTRWQQVALLRLRCRWCRMMVVRGLWM
jgi:hypothetical protein